MPLLETPSELADHLADLLGIYEDPNCTEEKHEAGECDCRVHWVIQMTKRIREATKNESRLSALVEKFSEYRGPIDYDSPTSTV